MPCAKETLISDDLPLLRALLASPTAAAVRTDAHGTVVDLSPGAAALLGWPREQVCGRSVDVLLPPDRRAEQAAVRARLLAGGAVPPLSTVWVDRSGACLEVALDSVAVDGGCLSLVRTVRRARPPAEAHDDFADSPVAQARADLGGRVLAVNPATERLIGRSAADLVGCSGLDLFAEDQRAAALLSLDRLAAGETSRAREEWTLVRGDGRRVQAVVTARTVAGDGGAPLLLVALEDVSDLRAAEEAVREQTELFDAVLQAMPVAICAYDEHAVCTDFRGQALRYAGVDGARLVGASLLSAFADVPALVAGIRTALRGEPAQGVVELGDRVWKGHHRPLRGDGGAVVGGLGILLDVTDLARAEQEVRGHEARLQALLRHASDVVTVVDFRGRLIYVSPAAQALLGHDERTLLWQPALEFDHPEDRSIVAAAWARVLAVPGSCETFECRVRHADGSWRWAEHRLTNLLDEPDVGGVVINLRETTERRRAESELRRLAVEDGLTGLANRTLLLDRVGQALQRGARRGDETGLVLLDVAGMAAHNARLGHAGGDALLRELARRLAAAVRPSDSVARVGADAFAVLYEDAVSLDDLRARAAALVAAVGEPFRVGDVEVVPRVHAGVARTPAEDAGALLAAAERELLAPRDDPGPSTGTGGRADAAALRRAVGGGELRLHLQPVVRLDTGAVAGAEALVRWQHPQRGLLLPAAFIALAEASGAVVELGAWVLEEACRVAAGWHARGSAIGVGINLSPRQIDVPGFERVVARVLDETGVDPQRVVLEVTESALMDSATALDTLRALKDLGVRLALDDFGTGYSSLTYLKRFPVDALKIDRSFVAGLGVDADDEAIVASVASLGRSVGTTVVAEGVETAAQLDVLRRLGVDQAQGWLWSPALPLDRLDPWLAEHAARLAPAAGGLPGPTAAGDTARGAHAPSPD